MSPQINLHFVALPHTQTTTAYEACAYTGKLRKLAPAMKSLGYGVYVYGSEEIDGDVTELVTVASKENQQKWFGDHDYHKDFFNITWDPNDEHWVKMNENAIREIARRIQPNDIICVIAGICQKEIADAFPSNATVEYGIGYTGVFSQFKVFESYAHMHWVYGRMDNDNGQFYDCVIPNYFEPKDFYLADKEDYYVWMGRYISRKGPEIAVEATRRIGSNLIMAGQGVQSNTIENGITTLVGDDITVSGEHIKHIGHVDIAQRAKLLAGAKGVFMATTYLEPFGGVSIEAMLSGTPVLATDFGAFPENIPHGIAGYRFRTIGEAAYYATMVDALEPQQIRDYAVTNFSVDVLKYKYDDYFKQIYGLYNGDDFYGPFHGRLDRYTKWQGE